MTRRIRVAGSAGGRGLSPCSRCSAARKASIGFGPSSPGAQVDGEGTFGRFGGRNAQWSLRVGLRKLIGGGLRPLIDPRLERGDFRGGQRRSLALGRHPPAVSAGDGVDDQALVALARHDRRTAVAPLPHQGRRVQPQPGLVFQRAVARVTPLAQDRLDFAGVVDNARRAANPQPKHSPAARIRSE